MEPLSLGTRRLFATLFFILFIIILPVVVLYASGYRLQGFLLVTTGGIHISVPVSGAAITLNGEDIERSSLFSKAFFLDNLEPGSYVIQATLDGYYPWSKNLVVESRLVTDVSMLAVPQPLRVLELEVQTATSSAPVADVVSSSATSTTKSVSETEFERVAASFATTTTALVPTGTTTPGSKTPPADAEGGAALIIEDGDISVRWERNAPPPSSFCSRPSLCTTRFFLEHGEQTATDAHFFNGGVVYRTLESGVFFVEADIRQPRLLAPIYSKPAAEFRIMSGALYIKDGGTLYAVESF